MAMLGMSGDIILLPPTCLHDKDRDKLNCTFTFNPHCKDGDTGLLPVYQTTRRHTLAHRYIDAVRTEQLTFNYHRAISLHTTHEIDKVSLNYTTIHRTPHYLRLQQR